MSASSAVSAYMTEPWHLLMTWGGFSGISSGAVASVLGATIVNRWFTKHRGLVMGLLTASTASGEQSQADTVRTLPLAHLRGNLDAPTLAGPGHPPSGRKRSATGASSAVKATRPA
ncbi:hypothetical protein G6F68_019345 [Rhizopus microsporus]|nr:hypothetical protein G6F68_019345 [Rhizopus microsporus]